MQHHQPHVFFTINSLVFPLWIFFALIILEIFTIITIIRIMIIKPIFSVGRDHRPWGGTCSGKLATSFGIVIIVFSFETSLLIIMPMTSAFSVNLKADAAGVGKVCVQRGRGGRDQHGAAGEEGSSLVIMIKIFRVIF